MFAAGRDQDVVALNGWCYAELAAALVDGDGRLRDVPWEVLPLYRTITATMATVGTISPFAMHYPNRAHPRRHPHGIRYLDCLAEINWKDYGLTGAFACGMVVQPPPPYEMAHTTTNCAATCCSCCRCGRMLRSPGRIPTEVGRMALLTVLDMGINQLSGGFGSSWHYRWWSQVIR